ncbi:unnamed protein product [Effrenium voratum]|nr:unnamed protein product [Effrenium voratum]
MATFSAAMAVVLLSLAGASVPRDRLGTVLQDLAIETQRLRDAGFVDELASLGAELEDSLARARRAKARTPLPAPAPEQLPQPIGDMASRISRQLEPFIAVGLICVTVALMKGRRPLDLFSVDIFSPWEASLAFTLSSLTGFLLVNQWVLSFLPSNPFTLYFSELAICFLAVTTCVPLLMGGSQLAMTWHTVASFVAVIAFGALCLADEISRVVYFFFAQDSAQAESEDDGLVVVPCFVVFVPFGLFSISLMKVAHKCGIPWSCLEPYSVACVRSCKAYVAARLAGRASASEAPVPLPAAVLVQVVGVGAFMAMIILQFGYVAWVRYNELRQLAVALLRPIDPIFRMAGAPLPMDTVDFAMPRILVSFYLALGCGALYEFWLMRSVLRGYRRRCSRTLPWAAATMGRTAGAKCRAKDLPCPMGHLLLWSSHRQCSDGFSAAHVYSVDALPRAEPATVLGDELAAAELVDRLRAHLHHALERLQVCHPPEGGH